MHNISNCNLKALLTQGECVAGLRVDTHTRKWRFGMESVEDLENWMQVSGGFLIKQLYTLLFSVIPQWRVPLRYDPRGPIGLECSHLPCLMNWDFVGWGAKMHPAYFPDG